MSKIMDWIVLIIEMGQEICCFTWLLHMSHCAQSSEECLQGSPTDREHDKDS